MKQNLIIYLKKEFKMKNTKEKILKALKGEQEIVINKCFGGFGLSNKAIKRYLELKGKQAFFYIEKGGWKPDVKRIYEKVDETYGKKDDEFKMVWVLTKDKGEEFNENLNNNPDFWGCGGSDIERDDEELVQVVKELGNKASGRHSKLEVVKIPSGVEWEIDEYDGSEKIDEVHRSWS